MTGCFATSDHSILSIKYFTHSILLLHTLLILLCPQFPIQLQRVRKCGRFVGPLSPMIECAMISALGILPASWLLPSDTQNNVYDSLQQERVHRL